MEVTKLLSIFKDLLEGEEEFNIGNELNNLLSQLDSSSYQVFSDTIERIKLYSEKNPISKYTPSKIKLLKKLNLHNKFGSLLYEYLKNLNEKSSIQSKNDLTILINERRGDVGKINSNILALESIGIKSYYEDLENFEVGLIIPSEISELNKINDILKKFGIILKNMNSSFSSNSEDIKVYSLSRNSLEFFFQIAISSAIPLAGLYLLFLKIKKETLKIKMLEKELKTYDLFDEIKEKFKKKIVDIKKKTIEEGVENLSKDSILNEETDRKELENKLRKNLEVIVTFCDKKDISIEITEPKGRQYEENETKKLEKIRNLLEKNHKIIQEIKLIKSSQENQKSLEYKEESKK